jgi:NADH dehydrogenase
VEQPDTTKREHTIIVGGGFGGLAAARSLRTDKMDVTIIDKTNHHLFQPLLYQVATAALNPGDIASPIRSIFRNRDNFNVMMGTVVDVDKEEKQIKLEDGRSLEFDNLVLAPGARYSYFGNDKWSENAPGLKTLADALHIREQILVSLEKAEMIDDPEERQPYLNYVIIGGGPSGVEMAGAIAEIAKKQLIKDFKNFNAEDTQIYLVEAMSSILNPYPPSLSEKAKEDLEDLGVNVLLDSPVTDVREDGVEIGDRFIETPNIIWAAGVSASPLIQTLEMPSDKTGRVFVEKDCSLPGYPNIFVIGDAAHVKNKEGEPYPALAPVALQEGYYVGRLLKDGVPKSNRNRFTYIDKGTMATIGRAKAVADIKGFKFSGFMAWLIWCFVHILYLIGFRNRFRVMAEWMWHYLTLDRGVRLITRRIGRSYSREDLDQLEKVK